MKAIEKYSFYWQINSNQGSLHLALEDNTGAKVLIDSPQEAYFLLDLMRQSETCYYNEQSNIISTSFKSSGISITSNVDP